MKNSIGILTAGGDAPGLNAAVSSLTTLLTEHEGLNVIGFLDGYEGLAYNRTCVLTPSLTDAWFTRGGTALGTSRNKPHKMPGGKEGSPIDMIDTIVKNYRRNNLECLICIGGGGTHKSALRLKQAGLNVITLPKTIDNDIPGTDNAIGFDTSIRVAAEELTALETTAGSHHRLMLVELMGHDSGWLTLGAGLAAGSRVILLPEFAYDLDKLIEVLRNERKRSLTRSLVVPVAEGALPHEGFIRLHALEEKRAATADKKRRADLKLSIAELRAAYAHHSETLALELERSLDWETRICVPAHLQRAGIPSTSDRLLSRRLAFAAVQALKAGRYGSMVVTQGELTHLAPIEDGARTRKFVTNDHPWMQSARALGIAFGDK